MSLMTVMTGLTAVQKCCGREKTVWKLDREARARPRPVFFSSMAAGGRKDILGSLET
jgi:hypothetical protein